VPGLVLGQGLQVRQPVVGADRLVLVDWLPALGSLTEVWFVHPDRTRLCPVRHGISPLFCEGPQIDSKAT